MTALIIDTSGSEGVAAIAVKGVLTETIPLRQGRELSKSLFPSIQSLIENFTPDFIAVGKGPGTFTGTRIGAITAQSLSYGWNIPLLPFPSSLLPDLSTIARTTYQSFLSGDVSSEITLVYISTIT
jgi:tRNA threonylcarbamoyl adenosine modification protein YeaZ